MSICTLNNSFNIQSNDFAAAKVAILMCTHNGDSFLAEQLSSIERQSYTNWTLTVSDDESKDGTLELLRSFSESWGGERLRVLAGPGRGFVANFLSLTCRADIEADFFAWSDQDDVWDEDKIQVALTWLKTVPEHIPALYCGRTRLVSEFGRAVGYSPLFCHPPSFSNALVQSIAGGNTMVFNHAARELLCEAGADLNIPSHDWWAYQLITGVGGVVCYDPEPKMQYRQHDENLIGSNSSWAARLVRLRMVFQGRFFEWNEQNINALEAMQHRLCEKHKVTFVLFKDARRQTLLKRLLGMRLAGLYRQTFLGNLGLVLAALLKKI